MDRVWRQSLGFHRLRKGLGFFYRVENGYCYFYRVHQSSVRLDGLRFRASGSEEFGTGSSSGLIF